MVWDGHVAMVVGNGLMVEAGDPVSVSPMRTTPKSASPRPEIDSPTSP